MAWGEILASSIPRPWKDRLSGEVIDRVAKIGDTLSGLVGVQRIVPHPDHVFRALRVNPEDVRVIIVGQDPYPNAHHAMGLAFSVPRGTQPLPPSARNIRTELVDDVGCELPSHFELSAWVNQGVLLLNRHLTGVVGSPGAHQSLGWSVVTDALIDAVVDASPHAVALLWGNQAAQLAQRLGPLSVLQSAHPSPLSAHRGFFGSKPFSRANDLLAHAGIPAIDWRLDDTSALGD